MEYLGPKTEVNNSHKSQDFETYFMKQKGQKEQKKLNSILKNAQKYFVVLQNLEAFWPGW